MNTDNEQNYLIRRIQTTIQNSNINLITPQMKFYSDTYGSCSLYPVDENTRLIPIPYSFLYRYQGEVLKNLNRLEYYSLIIIRKDDTHTTSELPMYTTYKSGRKSQQHLDLTKALKCGEIITKHYVQNNVHLNFS
jgi:hypothetical protein